MEACEYCGAKSPRKDNVRADVIKLLLALSDFKGTDKPFISYDYIEEKLIQVINGTTNWHPLVEKAYQEHIEWKSLHPSPKPNS